MLNNLFGLETEYGITVEGRTASDLIDESIKLVRSYCGPLVTGWNYTGEDARRDMRGFTASHLSTDPEDAKFDANRKSYGSAAEERSDRVLGNGARLYNDHGHPEYSTPECSDLHSLVAHDKAGEKIVWELAQARMDTLRVPISIYKNNSDFHGASYGTHECVLMERDVPTDDLISALIPFLVTRQIYVGAGKVGVEVDRNEPIFQISQRSDFFTCEASVDTLHNRPIVNTRDEPHAKASKYRRLHVIIGDANMSEWATAMKVGTLTVVLRLLETGWRPGFQIMNPVSNLKAISRDRKHCWEVKLADGHILSAIDVQRRFVKAAESRVGGQNGDLDWVLGEWRSVLADLETDTKLVADRVDWVAKRELLKQFMDSEGTNWSDPIMQSLDLAYHDLDPETGLFHGLMQAGAMRRIVSDSRIDAAMYHAPKDTRAFIRGVFIKNFAKDIRSISWNGIMFEHRGEMLLLDMNTLVTPDVEALNDDFSRITDLNEVVTLLKLDKAQ